MTYAPQNLNLLGDVSVDVSVELGRTRMPLRKVMSLGEESVVALDRLTDELLDVLVNGRLIAKAEVVAIDNRFGLRIVELAGQDNAPIEAGAPAQTAPLATEPLETPQSEKPAEPPAAPNKPAAAPDAAPENPAAEATAGLDV
jgi:flagellar motor switch protein FliN/FliY